MVCDPPSSAEELNTLIYSFLTGDKIEDVYTRSLDLVHLLGRPAPQNGVKLFFVEPSKDLGIGVFPKEGESIYDHRPEGHIIAVATVVGRELSQVKIYRTQGDGQQVPSSFSRGPSRADGDIGPYAGVVFP